MLFRRASPPLSHYPAAFKFDKQTFSLHCDPELFATEYALLISMLEKWFLEEVALFNKQDAAEDCLAQELRNFSPLAIADHPQLIGRIFQDTPTDNSARRFFELVLRIHITVDQRVLSVLQGRYYYHLLHTLTPTPQANIPDVSRLIAMARRYPWIWLMGPYQQATDHHSMKVTEIRANPHQPKPEQG